MEESQETMDSTCPKPDCTPKSNQDFLLLFDKLKPSSPQFQPNGDTFYLFEASAVNKKNGIYFYYVIGCFRYN